jgi:hypothetical protein
VIIDLPSLKLRRTGPPSHKSYGKTGRFDRLNTGREKNTVLDALKTFLLGVEKLSGSPKLYSFVKRNTQKDIFAF